MRQIDSIRRRLIGQRRLDDRGVAALEFALVAPVLFLMTFGVIELGMMMATLTSLEGGLKEASRYGITGQGVDDAARIENIRTVLNKHTIDLVDFSEATFTVKVYPSFSMVGKPEPFVDGAEYDEDGNPNPCHNGKYDGPEAASCPVNPLAGSCSGESFVQDIDGDGCWDADVGEDGAGMAGNVVAYSVEVPWHVMTPVFDKVLGRGGTLPLRATIVVRNEPNLWQNTPSGGGGS
jgi:hypothetical protein